MKRAMAFGTALAAIVTVSSAWGETPAWPQFRGPGGAGVAEEQKPPVEFGPDKNVRWKIAVPSGFSSPIVVGDLLVLTAFENDKLFTIAYRRSDGREAWRAQAPADKIEAYHPLEGSPAASTPATDGMRIVSYFGSCGLFCYDLAGKELWKYGLPTAATVGDFGTGVSPVIADDTVILVRDETKEPKVIAVDLKTGDLKWEKKRQSVSAFSTPVVWETAAGKQIAAPGAGRMIGYDLKTGEEKWFVAGMPAACCTTPVVADGLLYFAGWSPGDPNDESGFKMPSFDEILKQGDADGDGVLSKAESAKTFLKDFFDAQDGNKDGKYTREESDAMAKFMASSRNSAFALKAGGSGDVTETHVLWKKTTGLPYVPSAIAYRGQFFLVKDGGLLTVYDMKTGKTVHQGRTVNAGKYYASPVAANGHLYFVTLDDGVVTVLKPGPSGPEKVAENPPLGERVAATPAIAGDTLYVRTAGHLYAFGAK